MADNTFRTFKDKWERNSQAFYEETLREGSDTQRWILRRNGFGSRAEFSAHLAGRRRILDAGCGNGRVTALLMELAQTNSEIVGVDLVGAEVARNNFRGVDRVSFFAGDLLGDLSELGSFDFIYCQEVLHHTLEPRLAFHNLCRLLQVGGEISIYVYKQKAPAREYMDDQVRARMSLMSYEEAMKHSGQITEFARALSRSGLRVSVPDVELFGIEAGEFDIQRLIYHFFAKCYWNPDLPYEENVLVNYDWYHPQVASRHTLEEVEEWFLSAGLEILHRHVDFYGITVSGANR